MLTDTSKDRLGYFTLDDDGKVIVANWQAQNDQFSYFRSNPIEYVSKIEKYTMPYQLLIAVQINLGNEDFTIDLANLALQTVTILSIQDNTTTSYTRNVYTDYIENTITEETIDPRQIISSYLESAYTQEVRQEETSVQTNAITSQITKIDGWCAHFEREYSLNQTDTGYNQGSTQNLGSESGGSSIVSRNDNIVVRRRTQITHYMTTYTRTVTRTFSMGKTITTGNVEKFVSIVIANKDVKSKLSQNPEMLVELLKLSDSTSDMVDLMKYLIYKATGKNLGVTEFNFEEYDITQFNKVGSGRSKYTSRLSIKLGELCIVALFKR